MAEKSPEFGPKNPVEPPKKPAPDINKIGGAAIAASQR
jgi:hypothetical protein